MDRTLTPKGAATRQRIIEGAAAEIRENGVLATTLDDVRARTSTSKSQLFHYFPDGKEELLLAVARHEADHVIAHQQPQLGNLTSWTAWRTWRDRVLEYYSSQGEHCPLNVLVSQIGRNTPGAQAVVTEMMASWQQELVAGIQDMQRQGRIGADVDADRSAAALLAGLQGGVLIMLSTGSTRHLEAALDQAIQYLKDSLR